jgi:glycosyltransferase involved in cell wall biosynthesis
MMREKGVRELLAAAKLLREWKVAVDVLLAGGMQLGNPSSLSPAEVQSSPAVTWLGEVVPIDDLLASADMLVLPSWREGLPRTVIEAMAMAKAVVATDVPGCRDAVVHGQTGLLVPVRDATALARAIKELAEDPERRLAMGQAGRLRAVASFRQEIIEAQTLAVYRQHLGREL